MAVTGRGIIDDPFIVTTYAELVNTASTSGVYIELANDINAANEYLNNDVPLLTCKSYIDGKGYSIKNLYKKDSGALIRLYTNSKISNVHFTNIFRLASSGSFNQNSSFLYPEASATTGFYNCEFKGVISSAVFVYSSGYANNLFNQCNINLIIKNNGCFSVTNNSAGSRSPKINSCRVTIKGQNANSELFKASGSNSNIVNLGSDSYYKIDMPNFYEDSICNLFTFDNCVFDIKSQSNGGFNITNSSVSVSIANKTHAPNMTFTDKIHGVTDEYWLDAEYLDSIGFNIVYEPTEQEGETL